jgi:polysaccharide chain length determinant protein (PEP-CTERM system associated)
MQTPQEFSTASRRPLDVEDYIDMGRRHKAWILGPAFLGLVVAVVVAMAWPDTYVASAVMRVTPPRVPERLLPTNMNMEMSQRIAAMSQQVLSRGVVTSIITTFNLFPNKRKSVPMEDLVEEMQQKRIKITPIGAGPQTAGRFSSAFQISFSYTDRYVARSVVENLVSRFMDENTRDRLNQTSETTGFFTSQLASARKELEDIDARLTLFRVKNAGRLPDQMNSNLQQLNLLMTQRSTLNSNMNRTMQEKLLLESQLKSIQDRMGSVRAPQDETVVAARNERLVQIEREIQSNETTLAALREHYKDIHPDIQRIQTHLSFLKKQRDLVLRTETERAPETAPRRKPAAPNRELKDLEAAVTQVKALITNKDLEIADIVKEQGRLDGMIKAYQARIDLSPMGEKEYNDVMRDRDLAKRKFEELSQKQSVSQLSTDQENLKLGEMLEQLDPPALPQTPTEPKRPVIVSAGVAMGLVLGFFLAGAREMKDTTLKNLKDVRAYTRLTVLGSVPLLEDDFVVRRRRRMTWLAWATALLIGVLVMTGSVFYYYTYVNKI